MSERMGPDGLTRRQVLVGAGGAAGLAIVGGGIIEALSGHERVPRLRSFADRRSGGAGAFRSRPDLHPPTVTVVTADSTAEHLGHADPGFLFLGPGPVSLTGSAQYGPLLVDRRGAVVWFRPLAEGLEVTNFVRSQYRGEPVLVWWEGKVLTTGYGHGEAVLLDRSYREVARVRAAGGRSMDMHALTLTPAGTALFTCHPEVVPAHMSSLRGPRDTKVYNPIIQEVDIASGRLLLEWRGLDHIPLEDSYEPLSEPYDYLHPNSIQVLPDGNLLVSARHTWALYKLERRTGNVIWRLGGKRTEFRIDPGARFAWQHDARLTERVLTVFDNGAAGATETERQSRGLVLDVDESRRTVTLGKAYTSHQRLLAGAMGSVQVLPSGRVLVGWGTTSHTSEFAADGALLRDYALPAGMYSYRGVWLPWKGTPHQRPTVAAGRDGQSGARLVYASWNGATGVTGWLVDAGPRRDQLRQLGIAKRHGFETVIPLHPQHRFAAVTPLNRHGRPLRSSRVIKL